MKLRGCLLFALPIALFFGAARTTRAQSQGVDRFQFVAGWNGSFAVSAKASFTHDCSYWISTCNLTVNIEESVTGRVRLEANEPLSGSFTGWAEGTATLKYESTKVEVRHFPDGTQTCTGTVTTTTSAPLQFYGHPTIYLSVGGQNYPYYSWWPATGAISLPSQTKVTEVCSPGTTSTHTINDQEDWTPWEPWKPYYGASIIAPDFEPVFALPATGLVLDGRVSLPAQLDLGTLYDYKREVSWHFDPVECRYAISPQQQHFPAGGGSGSFTVTTDALCPLQVTPSADWITITSLLPLTGSATVAFSVAPNPGGPRSGTIAVGSRIFTVTQDGGCAVSISPPGQNFSYSGGRGSINVTGPAGCQWASTKAADWITIESGASGNGNGTVNYSVAANTGPARSSAITVNGQTFNVTQDAGPCIASFSPQQQNFPYSGGTGSFSVSIGAGCAWTAGRNGDWISITSGSGTGGGTVRFSVAANPGARRSGNITAGGQAFAVTQDASPCTISLSPQQQTFTPAGGAGTFNVVAGAGCAWTATTGAGWITITSGNAGTGNGTVNYSVAPNTGGGRSSGITAGGQTFTINQPGTGGVPPAQFVPVAPCRLMDTRPGEGLSGPFGPPTMEADSTRTIPVPQSRCNIPSAAAYSFNVTVVPKRPLGYLTLWPAGQPRPLVSTLNAPDGAVTANAAIVAAGDAGAVSVYVTDPTDVIIDINGYFPTVLGSFRGTMANPEAGTSAIDSYSFYAAQPCRVADTRNPAGPFGGPAMPGGQSRDFPVPNSSCSIPANAKAYSMNATVVPAGALGYLTLWPAGSQQPYVSTLNSFLGRVAANAALVPAGSNGAISAFVTDKTDLILDINGYFAPSGGPGALSFNRATPCRILDTRNPDGPFGGPVMPAGSIRSIAVPSSSCGIPAAAKAYSVNVTVVPMEGLSYLTVWPTGSAQPLVSTLNSFDAKVTANAAIVPAGAGGAISIYATNRTHVIVDINGYFAP